MNQVVLAGAGSLGYQNLSLGVLKAIQAAACILYDDLLDPSILNEASKDCQLIYVGKRKGAHYKSQEQINQLLIDCANTYPFTLRLKGGDPFIFGRGYEEIQALTQNGYPVRVLPGISSFCAMGAHFEVPLTDRNLSSSFLVVSAQSKTGDLFTVNEEVLKNYDGTLVILMGFSRLKIICEKLLSLGKPEDYPALLFYTKDGLPYQITGTLKTLPDKSAAANAPAIIFVGPTASLAKATQTNPFLFMGTQTLFDRLTDENPALPIQMGMKMTPKRIEKVDFSYLSKDHGWLVFYSVNGSTYFLEDLKLEQIDIRKLSNWKIACIGKQTAKPFEKIGIFPELIAKPANSDSLRKMLEPLLEQGESLHCFRAKLAKTDTLYDLHPIRQDLYSMEYQTLPQTNNPAGFIFGCSSAVRHANLTKEEKKLPAFAIGAMTGRTLQEYGYSNIILSKESEASSLANAIEGYFKNHKQT